jgi:hypothetical protein
MAYKFQLGEAKLSGSITQTDGTITALGLSNSDANITNVGELEADVIQADDTLLTLKGGSGNITQLVLDGGNISARTALQMSGSQKIQFGGTDDTMGINGGTGNLEISGAADISINAPAGDVDIALHNGTNGLKLGGTLVTATAAELNILDGVTATAAELNILDGVTATATEINNLDGFAAAVYAAANDSIVFLDSDGGIRSESNDDFLGAISAEGLEVNSNQLRIKRANDGALTFIGGSSDELSVLLSGSSLTKDADGLKLSDTIPGDRTFSNNITVGGNLTVQGSTTTVDSTTINISSSFTFEGPADDFETVLHAGTPVADTTVYLPELAAGTYYIPAFDADPSGTSLSVTPAELNLLDGGATVGSSITIADTDGIIVNDGGVTKLVPASDIKDYAVAASSLASANRRDGETLTIGMNYFSDSSSDASVVLPGSPEVGDLVYVKAGNLTSNAIIEVSRAGSQTIDGEVEVVLESPYAAITLIYVASNDWRIV